jgi:hypothetical protein
MGLALSESISQAAPTLCIKVPTSEITFAPSRLRNVGDLKGRQRLFDEELEGIFHGDTMMRKSSERIHSKIVCSPATTIVVDGVAAEASLLDLRLRGACGAGLLLPGAAIGAIAIVRGKLYLSGSEPSIVSAAAGGLPILAGSALAIGLFTTMASAAVGSAAIAWRTFLVARRCARFIRVAGVRRARQGGSGRHCTDWARSPVSRCAPVWTTPKAVKINPDAGE